MVISFKDIFAPSFWQAWNDFLNQKYTDMWFTGGRGCIDGDTLIDTPAGKARVRDFEGGEVLAFDNGTIHVAKADAPVRYTQENLYTVTNSIGDSITVTDEHKFLATSGWQMLRDLKIGDPILCSKNKTLTVSPITDIKFKKHDYYWDFNVQGVHNYCAQGFINHNSTKSSFVTMCIVLGMIRDAKEAYAHKAAGDKKWMSYLTHAIVYRKIAADLRISVYNQFVWSIEKLGLTNHFKFSVSPLRITYKATGQMIDFRGLDDPIKSKSIKAPFGYYKYNFFEELNQFDGIEEIRSVRQSIMRGGHSFQSFAAFNPSPCSADFCNVEARKIVEGRHVYHSDYRSVPREWLGETFFEQAEILRKDNERAYRHEYLGEVTGNGGAVFPNLIIREVPDEEIALYDMKFFGIDFGFSLDPSVYLEIRMDKNHHRIFIIDEIYQTNLRNIEFAELLKQKPSIGYNYIMCDSAEPKSIADLEAYGINALPVVKVERRFGYKYLQSFNQIIIDPRRCPHAAEEFALAEYKKLASGLFVSEYPKTNDHCQDAARYALSEVTAGAGMF